jgi:hypothetical protein
MDTHSAIDWAGTRTRTRTGVMTAGKDTNTDMADRGTDRDKTDRDTEGDMIRDTGRDRDMGRDRDSDRDKDKDLDRDRAPFETYVDWSDTTTGPHRNLCRLV